jgi:transcriptional regulator with XRE-family HTH domain
MERYVDDRETRRFFELLGDRCRRLRRAGRMTQEDLMDHGFSLRHYQQIEAGLAINVKTALRLAEAFRVDVTDLLRGLTRKARDGRRAALMRGVVRT